VLKYIGIRIQDPESNYWPFTIFPVGLQTESTTTEDLVTHVEDFLERNGAINYGCIFQRFNPAAPTPAGVQWQGRENGEIMARGEEELYDAVKTYDTFLDLMIWGSAPPHA